MFDFLKTLGEGVLYTLLSPFIILIVLVCMVINFVMFFVMLVKRCIMFFQGKDMSIDSELDRAAKYHIQFFKKRNALQNESSDTPTPAPQPAPQQTTIVQPIIIQTGPDGKIKASNIDYVPAPSEERPIRRKPVYNEEPLDMATKEISYDELRKSEDMEDK